jgi:thioredoxin reductase (NADPH)
MRSGTMSTAGEKVWRAAPHGCLRIVGRPWSPDGHRIRDFLARSLVSFEWSDVVSPEGGAPGLPVVIFPDGSELENPSLPELARRVGLQSGAPTRPWDVVIVGGGPAGLAAAVTAASDGLSTLVVERDVPGGQASRSRQIENYMGFPDGVSGSELARRALRQARGFGAELLSPVAVTALQPEGAGHLLQLSNGGPVWSRAVILTAGVTYRTLAVPGVERLAGRGIYHGAAISETAAVRGHDVFIVGGGNSAAQAAMHLAPFAVSVTLLVRRSHLHPSMSAYLRTRIAETGNIRLRLGTELVEARGDSRLRSLLLRKPGSDVTEEVPAHALFVFIGAAPQTDWLPEAIRRDDRGYVLTGSDLGAWPLARGEGPAPGSGSQEFPSPAGWFETSVPGVYAAGDIRSGSIKGVAASAGEGAMVAQLVRRTLAGPLGSPVNQLERGLA